MTESTARPVIMLLSLGRTPEFRTEYSNLLNLLNARAQIDTSIAPFECNRFSNNSRPAAILITDAAFVQTNRDQFKDTLLKVQEYVFTGGTAVFCCDFARFAHVDKLDNFFSVTFGLPWLRGEAQINTFALNPAAAVAGFSDRARGWLAPAYSTRALLLRNVDDAHSVYLSAEEEYWDHKRTPVAWAQFGRGWVGYVGDVDVHDQSAEIILSMCGL